MKTPAIASRTRRFPARFPRQQRGAALVVGLLFLLLATLIRVVAVRQSSSQ